MESFWNSRGLDKYSVDNKKLLLTEKKQIINDVKISENEIDRYINVFRVTLLSMKTAIYSA